MDLGGQGAGVMLALAAVLWLVYLVPTWFKRREYLATERNAIRLQQTLRILAESSEAPTSVSMEADARSIAERQRALRMEAQRAAAALRAQDAAAARQVAERMAAARQHELAAQVVAAGALPRRVRRTRAVLAAALIAAVAVGLVQITALVITGVGGTAGVVLALCGFVGSTSLVLLSRLAGVARAKAQRRRVPIAQRPRVAQPFRDFADQPQRTWTPTPLPKPLAHRQAVGQPPVMADPLEHERRAAAEAARELARLDRPAASARSGSSARSAASARTASIRPAPTSAPVLPEPGAPAAPQPPSRYAAMGRVDGYRAAPDLDEALRRRRAI